MARRTRIVVDTLDQDEVTILIFPEGGLLWRLRSAWNLVRGRVPESSVVDIPREDAGRLVTGLAAWLAADQAETDDLIDNKATTLP